MLQRRLMIEGGGFVIVHIIFNTGVASITVNGKVYYENTDIKVKPGTVLNWRATSRSGYILYQSSGTVEVIEEGVTISPTTYQTVNVTFSLGTGVASVKITSSTIGTKTITSDTTYTVPSGEYISWTATASSGYKLSSSSGSLNASNTTVSIWATAIVYPEVTNVTVTGRRYDGASIDCYISFYHNGGNTQGNVFGSIEFNATNNLGETFSQTSNSSTILRATSDTSDYIRVYRTVANWDASKGTYSSISSVSWSIKFTVTSCNVSGGTSVGRVYNGSGTISM